MADQLEFHKGSIVNFRKYYIPSRYRKYRSYQDITSTKLHLGILVGKTVCYEGVIIYGTEDEPSSFIPKESITFWLVEPNNNNRYLKPYLVREEDLFHAQTD